MDRCDEEEGCVSEPGVEGPADNPTCCDDADNDCDELVDADDEDCHT